MKLLITILALQVSFMTAAFAESADCRGCKAVEDVELKFRRQGKRTQAELNDLLNEGLLAVNGLKRNKQGKLTQPQAEVLVRLIRTSDAFDPMSMVLDGDLDLVPRNRKLLEQEARRLNPADAENVRQALQRAGNAMARD